MRRHCVSLSLAENLGIDYSKGNKKTVYCIPQYTRDDLRLNDTSLRWSNLIKEENIYAHIWSNLICAIVQPHLDAAVRYNNADTCSALRCDVVERVLGYQEIAVTRLDPRLTQLLIC